MRKVKPTIKALFICLMCLCTFTTIQAQEFKDVSSHPVLSESKKNLADQREIQIEIPQTPQPFTPTERAATPVQTQQLEIISNSSLTKTVSQKRATEGQSSNIVVEYKPESVKMTLEQMQQIRLDNGRDNRIQPPVVNMPNQKSAICGGEVTFDDPSICSTPPVVGTNISIVVDAFECTFSDIPEIDNGDGTLTVAGLAVFVDPNGANIFLGVVLESETFNTTACSTMPLMVPPNLSCAPTFTEFAAVTNTFIVDAVTGVISSATIDDECPVEFFTVTINPNLTAQVVTDEGAACGTLTAALVAEDGTQCATATAVCAGPDDVPSITFSYPFPDPMDGTTYQECPPTQTITGVPCTGCPCGGEVDYEDVVVCNVDDGTGGVFASATELSCMITPEVDNGDGTLTVYSFDIYSPDQATGVFVGSIFESVTFNSSACNGSLDIILPVNTGCDPVVFQFEVVTAINTIEAASGSILDFVNDDSCDGTETFSVTINPSLTAGIVADEGATCGALTAGLFAEDGTLCPGSEMTAMCINFGDEPSVTLVDPFGCADAASLTITGASCEGCECGGMVDYADAVECSADLNGDGTLDIIFPEVGCNVNAETANADGTLTIYSLDLYTVDAGGNLGFLGSLFESATFGVSACTGDLPFTNFPVNQTCDAATFTFTAITAINQVDPDGTIIDFVDDPACTPEVFSATINPTLTAQIVDDTSDDCGNIVAFLFSEDGTQCAGTQATSTTCNPDTGDGMTLELTLEDPFGCADAAALTVSAECDGCFPIMIVADPECDCFPDGIDLDGDGVNDLALETIVITSAAAGEGWTTTSVTGLVNPDGTPSTATVVDNGDGTYTYTSYIPADGTTTYSASFTNNDGDVASITGGECPPCPPPLDEVPTVGEWGLIMLGLLMTITAVVGIRARREEEIYA